jgi:hypothetical protein
MRKKYILKLSFLIAFLFLKSIIQAQPISFNTQTLGTGYNGANSFNSICFVIHNNNSFPAVLTSVSNYFAAGATGNFELWYSATSIYGAPGTVSAGPVWTQIATNNNVTVASGTQSVVFPTLSFSIPAGATYRFYLASPTVTVNYTTSGAGVTPNIFTNSNVELIVGDYTNAGQYAGWGGAYPTPINNPRGFTGTVTLNLISTPCSGVPTAGTANATPNNPCPGVPVNLNLTGLTNAGNLFFQWWRSTSPTGPWVPIPGSNSPSVMYTPPAGSTTYYTCVVTCQNSGGLDTATVAGPVIVQPFSPTSPCYCNTSAATFTADEEITNVTIGTLNNTTTCSSLSGTACTGTGTASLYSDFTSCLPYPILYKGLAQTANLTVGSCGTFNFINAFKIYIDYNQNTVFTDPGEEVYFSGTAGLSCVPPTTVNATFTVPVTALSGPTRMRVINQEGGQSSATTIVPCGSYGYGETEDYVVNIVTPSPYDPAVQSINVPTGTCFTANETVTVQVANYGSNTINLTTNPVTCTLEVNGPLGPVNYFGTLSSGTLNAYGATTQTLTFNNVNMFDGGSYCLNTTLTIGSAGGVVNGSLTNDSLFTPVCRSNFRPTAGPDYELCQFDMIPFGQGLTVSGCATPILDSQTIVLTIAPTTNPTAISPTGAALFATGVLPTLPQGSLIQNCDFIVTNLSTQLGGWANETRFPIFHGPMPVQAANVVYTSTTGNTALTIANYTWVNNPPASSIGNLYTAVGAGGSFNVGYHSTWSGNATSNGYALNAGGNTTVATIKIRYTYVPASYEWYNVPTGGSSLYAFSPFDPLTTAGSGITNSNSTGTFTFYAACTGSSNCRVPVDLNINPTPQAFQDTLYACEFAPSSNGGIFDLTNAVSTVSGGQVGTSVDFFNDQFITLPVPFPTNDTSSTNFIYSKVYYASTGCYSSDSVYLVVNTLPDFTAGFLTGFACAPASIDVASLINPFATIPAGSDTLYYEDPAFSVLHPNPHTIGQPDTVYMVIATTTNPVCSDTAIAYIDVQGGTNHIASQDITFNFSNCGNVGNNIFTLTDGNADTLRTATDCKKVVAIQDIANGTDLGSIFVNEDIACQTPFHNGQPYVNREYTITPTTSDSAYVCLYYLDDDFGLYNGDASLTGWPLLPTSTNMSLMGNICITKVDNGPINNPGSTATTIPNSDITASYDPNTTVWTVCFPVGSFSSFYCHTCNPGNAPLPVMLSYFKGRKQDQTSVLSWSTVRERNNSHFILERSRDGKTFSAISAAIPSQALNGNSEEKLDYTYTDQQPMNGHNYYRLMQVDLDGKNNYSQIVDVYFGNETLVNMYPNPVQNQLTVEVNTPKATTAELRIMDATGRVVRTVVMNLSEGLNETEVSMEGLADGVYLLRLSNDKGLNYSQMIRKN